MYYSCLFLFSWLWLVLLCSFQLFHKKYVILHINRPIHALWTKILLFKWVTISDGHISCFYSLESVNATAHSNSMWHTHIYIHMCYSWLMILSKMGFCLTFPILFLRIYIFCKQFEQQINI